MSKVIVSGSSGFIGRNLVPRLIQEGYDVTPFIGDVRLISCYNRLPKDAKYFFHFGAPSSQLYFEEDVFECMDSTVRGFMTVAEWCKTNGVRLIYASSYTVYGTKMTPYAQSKAICERLADAYNLNALGLRMSMVYGLGEEHKGEYASVFDKFVHAAFEKKQPIVYGDGNQERNLISTERAMKIIMDNLDSKEKTIDITGFNITLNDLWDKMKHVDSKKPKYVKEPKWYNRDFQLK